jgi:hypothetical protein
MIMRRHTIKVFAAVAALGLWLSSLAPSHAHIVVTQDPAALQSGLTYEWLAEADHGGDGQISGSVGAKSWAEPGQPAGAKGWTHTSDWVALDLSAMHETSLVTIELARGATGDLFPAFSLFSGWETVNSDATNHTFNNIGNISWATSLTFIDHVANAGGVNGTESGVGLTSVSKQFLLAPGLYTIALGGNPSFDLGQTGSHAFIANLDVAAVPVPAAVYLFGSGLVGLVGLARRRMTA